MEARSLGQGWGESGASPDSRLHSQVSCAGEIGQGAGRRVQGAGQSVLYKLQDQGVRVDGGRLHIRQFRAAQPQPGPRPSHNSSPIPPSQPQHTPC
jgi:hypothetical protein